jgi:hypothetical protein
MAAPLTPAEKKHTEANLIYYNAKSFEVAHLTNTDSKTKYIETPPAPSAVGQYFNAWSIHLAGATSANVPNSLAGVEVHFAGPLCSPGEFP